MKTGGVGGDGGGGGSRALMAQAQIQLFALFCFLLKFSSNTLIIILTNDCILLCVCVFVEKLGYEQHDMAAVFLFVFFHHSMNNL